MDQTELIVETRGRGTYEITSQVSLAVAAAGAHVGLCHLFCTHTSASLMTQSSLTVPVSGGRLALGTWQGIFLWEHRAQGHRRRVVVTIQ